MMNYHRVPANHILQHACQPWTSHIGWRGNPSWPLLTNRFPVTKTLCGHAERNYEAKHWSHTTASFTGKPWNRKTSTGQWRTLGYNYDAFTGRARSIARCSLCLQDNHSASECPRNSTTPYFGWFLDPSPCPGHMMAPQDPQSNHLKGASLASSTHPKMLYIFLQWLLKN